MMLSISRQTVRQTWRPYAGAFVALACGVVLIAVAVTLIGAVDQTSRRSGVTAAEKAQLDDLAAMFGMMSGVALFMAVFVVASTFGFVVAARRRELGMLRLIGATPRQVRRMVLGEAGVVALVAAAAGGLLASALAPALPALLRARGITDLRLELPPAWIAWTVAAPCAVVVALIGSWRASKRAAKVSPVAALHEAALERRRPGFWQAAIGIVCLAAVVAVFVVRDEMNPLLALVCAILLPEVAVVGLICFGRVLFPLLAGWLAAPFVRRDVTAHLAREHLRTSARVPAALAAPILAISAIAGSMILALSLTADWTSGLDRAQLKAPLVVETGGDPAAAEILSPGPSFDAVDPRLTTDVLMDGAIETVDVVDGSAMERARGLRAVRGDLGDLGPDAVAVTETYAFDQAVGVGDRIRLGINGDTVRPSVVAVVPDAPDLYGEVLVSAAMVGEPAPDAVPELVFVDPADGTDLRALLADTDARVLTADAWIDEVEAQTRAANNVGLWVLLGPAGLYAAIAIVNAVLIGASQRRTQLRTVGLLGATESQRRRMALWEAGLVGVAALLAGAVVTGYVGWLVSSAIRRDLGAVPMTVPWLPLLAVLLVCLGLALLAALVGSRRPRAS
jgi:putative ABC transport system permease protein